MADDRQFGYEEGGAEERSTSPDDPAAGEPPSDGSVSEESPATESTTESPASAGEPAESADEPTAERGAEPTADSAATPANGPSERGPVADPAAATRDGGTDLPLRVGGLFGVGAFLLSYVGTLMVVYGALSAGGGAAEETAAGWQISGMALLSSLGAELQAGGDATSLIGASGLGADHVILLIAVPVITVGAAAVVTATGYGLVGYTETDGDTLEDALKTALLVVPGWLVLTLVTAVLAGWEDGGGTSYGVATGEAFLFAGLLFPALFALLGGALARWPEPVDALTAKIGA